MSIPATDRLLEIAAEHHRVGNLAEARRFYQEILAVDPQCAAALFRAGLLELQEGHAGAALAYITHASAADPGEATFELYRGHALQALERWNEAADAYRQSLHLQPNFADAQMALGIVLQRSGHLARAATAYRQALTLKPEDSRVWGNLGTVLRELGDIDESIRSLKSAMALDPGIVSYAVNLGASLCRKRDFRAAEALLRDALRREPNRADAALNLGSALKGQGLPQDALEHFRRAVALRPNYVEAWNALADAYKALGDFASACAAYESAIAARPDFVPAFGNLGGLLCLLRQHDKAEAVLRRGLGIDPQNTSLHTNLGTVLKDMGRLDEAIECYRKALETDPSNSTAHSNLAYSLTFQSLDPEPLLAVCANWNARVAGNLLKHATHHPQGVRNRRLRIGYVSPDFRDHCQSLFTLPLLAHHDHDLFEIFCYSTVEQPDDVTRRIAAHADGWREATLLEDAALSDLIREDGIDILVDLTMHMANGRPLVFARKPAPIQIAWLAYPGTTGIGAMDYRLSDPRLDPEGFDRHYSERTLRLPDTFWCYDPMADQPINALPAIERGYPTFGCLNNPCKVTDTTLDLWGGVMRALPNARLSLLSPGGHHAERLLGRLETHGIASSRVELVGFQPRAHYLRAYLDIDLALDTLPYNGHTTSLDALWMGVPVVTRVGRTCVGRGGLSQLFHVDLLELAAESDAAFVNAAVALATDLPRLAALRQTLRPRLERSALMDAPRFARIMEEVYQRVWARYCGDSADSAATL
jgi:protein O-GlcNAc transferase